MESSVLVEVRVKDALGVVVAEKLRGRVGPLDQGSYRKGGVCGRGLVVARSLICAGPFFFWIWFWMILSFLVLQSIPFPASAWAC